MTINEKLTMIGLKIIKFLSRLFGSVVKHLDEKDKVNFEILTSEPG